MWRLFFLSLLGLACPPVAAGELTVCVAEHLFLPLRELGQERPGQYLVRIAVERQDEHVRFVGAPWRRCISGVQAGQYDAVLGAAAAPSYTPFMRFPMKDGQPDVRAAIGSMPHVVLRLAGARAGWDGTAFTAVTGPVCYPSGVALVREKLATLKVAGNDNAKTGLQLGGMLVRHHADLVVLPRPDADKLLKDAQFTGKLEMLPEPFVVGYAYLGVGAAVAEARAPFMAAVWADIARQRADPGWAALERKLQARTLATRAGQ